MYSEVNKLQDVQAKVKVPFLGLKKADRGGTIVNIQLLRNINIGFLILWCLLVAATAVSVSMVGSQTSLEVYTKDQQIKDPLEGKKKAQVKPFSYYANIISSNSIFRMTREEAGADKGAAMQTAPSEILANYSLTGIISGDNPQAVIEDRKSGRTYFLNRGQFLGNFKIDGIMKDKVILELKGQKFELSL